MQSFANIEAKYAEEFAVSGAIDGLPPVIHDMPEMIETKQKPEPNQKGSESKKDG